MEKTIELLTSKIRKFESMVSQNEVDLVSKLETELTDLRFSYFNLQQDHDSQLRVMEKRLMYATTEADKYKHLGQKNIHELAKLCSCFLWDAANDFEMDFELSPHVLNNIQNMNEDREKNLEKELNSIRTQNQELKKKYDAVFTCPICDEGFESSGNRIPSKLKCQHIVCHSCAHEWLKTKGTKASCPHCRTLYSQRDIQPIIFNF